VWAIAIGLILGIAGGVFSIYVSPPDFSESPRHPSPSPHPSILIAEPIPRKRMELLWMDGKELEVLRAIMAGMGNYAHGTNIGPKGSFQKNMHDFTREDVEWALCVDRIAAQAADASKRGNFEAAINHYEEALRMAPGADIYLMSIGACYANMNNPEMALPYLQRAHAISPSNQRILKNLRGLQLRIGGSS
jgi:tetratricopeptide (TPR) repeat protein